MSFAFRLLLVALLFVWVKGEKAYGTLAYTTCHDKGGICVPVKGKTCTHELDLPGCGVDEMCCSPEPIWITQPPEEPCNPTLACAGLNGRCDTQCGNDELPSEDRVCGGENCICCVPRPCSLTRECAAFGGRCDTECGKSEFPNKDLACIGEKCMCCVPGCIWNNKLYQNGESIPNICTDMTCVNGYWVTEGKYDGRCGKCYLRNDPHITTFDTTYYHWHGTCNYSISQPNFGYAEKFGIYGQFRQCNSQASCINTTTFTDNPHTVIEVLYTGAVTVNNDGYTVKPYVEFVNIGGWPNYHPVLAWTANNCNMFLGSQGYLLMTCQSQIYVFAYPNLLNGIHGLCGFYSNNPTDDFVDREEMLHSIDPYPYAFPISWTTADQLNEDCHIIFNDTIPEVTKDPCFSDNEKLREICVKELANIEYEGQLASRVTRKLAVESCVSDLCLMIQNKANQTDIDQWIKQMKQMMLTSTIIEVNTSVSATPGPIKA